jgi:hypothetical protein
VGRDPRKPREGWGGMDGGREEEGAAWEGVRPWVELTVVSVTEPTTCRNPEGLGAPLFPAGAPLLLRQPQPHQTLKYRGPWCRDFERCSGAAVEPLAVPHTDTTYQKVAWHYRMFPVVVRCTCTSSV